MKQKEYEIVRKRPLNASTVEFSVFAPEVALKAKGGQFVIIRVDEEGERVPFTVADADEREGTVTLVVQLVGATTHKMAALMEGDALADLVGPLGNPTELDGDNIILVGGGIGAAVVYPQTAELKKRGKKVRCVIGARNKELLLYREEFARRSDELEIVTDDGSLGRKGFVTDALRDMIERGGCDLVFAVGPLPMMKAAVKVASEYGIRSIVSMNSIMVDGTGMCGGCRLTVGGKTKYACVDGPEFDGSLVDFDEAIARSKIYRAFEADHLCRLKEGRNGR